MKPWSQVSKPMLMQRVIRTLVILSTASIAGHVRSDEPPKDFINSIGMRFKMIPAGEFMMGNDRSANLGQSPRRERFKNEVPHHRVRITKPFYLGVTEVTQEQYEKVMGQNPSHFSETGKGAESVKGMDSSFPVETVSWYDAVKFCTKLSAEAGQTYRLPTEAEWEYACRAGSTAAYCSGEDKSHFGDHAWWGGWVTGGNCLSERYAHRVGQKKANPFGLHDMHGNVWEWCSDWHGMDYYAKSPLADPTGPTTGSYRVRRGGSWYSVATECRSTYRSAYVPTYRSSDVGFRVAIDPLRNEGTLSSKLTRIGIDGK